MSCQKLSLVNGVLLGSQFVAIGRVEGDCRTFAKGCSGFIGQFFMDNFDASGQIIRYEDRVGIYPKFFYD